jgi:hypothetical protein
LEIRREEIWDSDGISWEYILGKRKQESRAKGENWDGSWWMFARYIEAEECGTVVMT